MNFEEWYKKYCEVAEVTGPHKIAKESWYACKREILKILYDQCSIDGYQGYYPIEDKIERL